MVDGGDIKCYAYFVLSYKFVNDGVAMVIGDGGARGGCLRVKMGREELGFCGVKMMMNE